jgi:phenylacetate-CoA ligase
LGNYLKSNSKNIARKKINKIFCLGEKVYNSSIIDLKKTFPNAVLKSKYGCMESAGIGYQCKYLHGNNYHIYPDRFVEILPLSQEEKFPTNGLIVVTTLNKRLVPLLRYRTEDLGSIIRKKCQCGQELTLEVMGRQNDIFILASIHLSTDLIEKAINRSGINTSNFNVEIKKIRNLDSAEIKIEVNGEESPSVIKNITQKIREEIFQEVPDFEEAILSKKLGYFRVKLVPVGSIRRMGLTGKMKRINDLRK